jgi:hypothetical protein
MARGRPCRLLCHHDKVGVLEDVVEPLSTPFRWGRDGDAQADSRTLRLAPAHEGERDAGVASASNRSLSGSWPFAIMSYSKTGDHRRPRW